MFGRRELFTQKNRWAKPRLEIPVDAQIAFSSQQFLMQETQGNLDQLNDILISVASTEVPEIKMKLLTRLCMAFGNLSMAETRSARFISVND